MLAGWLTLYSSISNFVIWFSLRVHLPSHQGNHFPCRYYFLLKDLISCTIPILNISSLSNYRRSWVQCRTFLTHWMIAIIVTTFCIFGNYNNLPRKIILITPIWRSMSILNIIASENHYKHSAVRMGFHPWNLFQPFLLWNWFLRPFHQWPTSSIKWPFLTPLEANKIFDKLICPEVAHCWHFYPCYYQKHYRSFQNL